MCPRHRLRYSLSSDVKAILYHYVRGPDVRFSRPGGIRRLEPESFRRQLDYLQQRLRFPDAPELIEILKTLYTDEEAALAPKLPFLPMTLEGLVDRTGVEKGKLLALLENMADKGIAAVETLGPYSHAG